MRRGHLERRPRAEMSSAAALGFAPHSGWSVLVALGLEGSDARPRLLARERVELSGPEDPASKQPYHAVESLPIEEAARKLAVFEADAERRAHATIASVLAIAGRGRLSRRRRRHSRGGGTEGGVSRGHAGVACADPHGGRESLPKRDRDRGRALRAPSDSGACSGSGRKGGRRIGPSPERCGKPCGRSAARPVHRGEPTRRRPPCLPGCF